MGDLEPSRSRGNDCSHSELFWKDLQNLPSSTSLLVLRGTSSLILPFLDNPFHKDDTFFPLLLVLLMAQLLSSSIRGNGKKLESDHHHESSAWVGTDAEWQHL